MTDRTAFLEAILSQPDEDLPRLIFADWLEEQGDAARAEFIRVQCDLARLPRRSPDWRALAEREMDLLSVHGGHWRAEVPAFPGIVWQDFERGFLSIAQVTSLEGFTRAAPLVCRVTPLQTAHFVEFGSHDLERLVAVPELSHLRRLSLWRAAAPRGVKKLVASPHLAALRSLTIWAARFDDRAVETLCDTATLPSLTALDLSDNQITNKGLQRLLASPLAARLTELLLSRNRLSALGALALARAPHLADLTFLDLRHNDIVEPTCSTLRDRFGDRVLV